MQNKEKDFKKNNRKECRLNLDEIWCKNSQKKTKYNS